MLHIVLFQPEIPQNTGNIGRMCALTRSRLHLIHPLGYVINDRNLRRAGMDYWKSLDVHEHADWAAFRASAVGPKRLWLFTTKTTRSFWNAVYADGDGLLERLTTEFPRFRDVSNYHGTDIHIYKLAQLPKCIECSSQGTDSPKEEL